jgi:hypothetical protein
MVLRLASALDVPLRERNGLLLAAGFAALYPHRPLDDPALDRVAVALNRMLVANWEEVAPALLERARREAIGGVLDLDTPPNSSESLKADQMSRRSSPLRDRSPCSPR